MDPHFGVPMIDTIRLVSFSGSNPNIWFMQTWTWTIWYNQALVIKTSWHCYCGEGEVILKKIKFGLMSCVGCQFWPRPPPPKVCVYSTLYEGHTHIWKRRWLPLCSIYINYFRRHSRLVIIITYMWLKLQIFIQPFFVLCNWSTHSIAVVATES